MAGQLEMKAMQIENKELIQKSKDWVLTGILTRLSQSEVAPWSLKTESMKKTDAAFDSVSSLEDKFIFMVCEYLI